MKATNKKSVNMTYKALLSYVLNTNYRNISGVLAVMISVVAIIVLVLGWGTLTGTQKVIVFLLGISFTVLNPIMLAFKAFRQYKLSPSYKKPLDYTFEDDGIMIEQGELSQKISWKMVHRILLTKSMLAIYTSRMHAFVIPTEELGEDRGKILTAIVQFTDEYRPMISGNLKEYRSGKGYKGNKL